MARGLCLSVFVAAALLASTAVLFGQGPQPIHALTIRVYDVFGMDSHELRTAQRIGSGIFARAGIALSWRTCGSVAEPSEDACADLVQPTELLVRIVAAPPQTPSFVLGYSLVDPQTRTGTLATLLADHIKQRAAHARITWGTLLGRTMAHELGHLMLGSTAHAQEGLMRAHWTDEALRRGLGRDVAFSSAEVARIVASLDARRSLSPMDLATLFAMDGLASMPQ